MSHKESTLYHSHLDTMLFLVEASLDSMIATVDALDSSDSLPRLSLRGQLANLSNMVAMLAELASSHELALRESASTLQRLAGAGLISQDCLDDVLSEYTAAMGELEADRLFAAALEA